MNIEAILREYIDKTIHMSLATSRDNNPWVCEVHFAYDQDLNLYFCSLASRRHSQEIADNPRVAGNIVRQHAPDEYPHAVYFEGTAERISDESAFSDIAKLFINRLGADESIIDDAKDPDGHQFYKITVATWYAFGKFGGDEGQKDELSWNGGSKQ